MFVCVYVQVARLTQREQTLEQRLKMACHENEELKDSVSSLHKRLDLQEQQSHTHIQQVRSLTQHTLTDRLCSIEQNA